MKSYSVLAKYSFFASLTALALFSACGENTTTEKIVETATAGVEVVESVKDLPKCTKENEGEQAIVKGESSVRICIDKKWFATKESARDTVFMEGDFSCTTQEFKDKSGLKIICNGDSIGVVLNGSKGDKGDAGKNGENGVAGKDGKNGADGEQGLQGEPGEKGEQGEKGDPGAKGDKGDSGEKGKDGVGCTIVNQTDSSATIKCGDSTMTLKFRVGGSSQDSVPGDTWELDSEKVAISLDTLSGFSQKGPFLKGSTVYLYELSDGRTLKQTNGNFRSVITSDSGRYKFQSRDLVSQYALLVVEGKYRNEITGLPTATSISLEAYTNMLSRRSANVNLLTHLEKDRVYFLVTKESKTVRAAKKQAQTEIFDAFHIDASQFKMESEDLDVFGKTDADAALLAISILLQGNDSETDLSVLLTEFSNDMALDGTWDDASAKVRIADWAAIADTAGKLALYRSNVEKWKLSKKAPEFEKFVHRFWSVELGLGVCGSDSVPVGMVKNVSNSGSGFYAENYLDTEHKGGMLRFTCADDAKWRVASDLEKDRYGWKPKKKKDGTLLTGPITGKKMVWDADTLRYANDKEIEFNRGCVSYILDETIVPNGMFSNYKCTESGWVWSFLLDGKLSTFKDSRDGNEYQIIDFSKGVAVMVENLRYEYKIKPEDSDDSVAYGNICNKDNCKKYGRYYSWAAAMDSAGVFSENGKGCGINLDCSPQYPVRGICPEGWHLPTETEWKGLFDAIRYSYGDDVINERVESNISPFGDYDRWNAHLDSVVAHALQSVGYKEWLRASNTSLISAIPAGYCTSQCSRTGNCSSECTDTDLYAIFWTSTWYPTPEYGELRPSAKGIFIHTDKVDIDDFNNSFFGLNYLFSVRCFADVKD
jgi:uncharacterized protein (TIGR02145 family)